jgi:alpha-tubulin suppressor-like RCC1 family protein
MVALALVAVSTASGLASVTISNGATFLLSPTPTIHQSGNLTMGVSHVVSLTSGTPTTPALTVVVPSGPPRITLKGPSGQYLAPGGQLVAWGSNEDGESSVRTGYGGVIAIAGGKENSLVLTANGKVQAWGDNFYDKSTVPFWLDDVIAIAAGEMHTAALKRNGTVVQWGAPGQETVPAGLKDVIAIDAGRTFTVALKSDGTVVAWGWNSWHQLDVPAGLKDVVAISCGEVHTLALKSDGTVVAWGYNMYGYTNVPPNLTDVVAVAAGYYNSAALKRDGTVVTWGQDINGHTRVPAGLTGVVALSAGDMHMMALKEDGTVVCWGLNYSGQTNVPANLFGALAVNAGSSHSLVIKNHENLTGAVDVGRSGDFPFTITNSSSGLLNIGSVSVEGGNAEDFSVTTDTSTPLNPWTSRTLTVSFKPLALGERRTMLRLVSDDPSCSIIKVWLSGTGKANTAPSLQVPANTVIAEATSPQGAPVTFSTPVQDAGERPLPEPVCTPANGSVFPIGDTTVNVLVTDHGGLTASGSFTVRVRDTTAPVITPPSTVKVPFSDPAGAIVHYPDAVITDAVGVTSITYSQASGTRFPIGTTTVSIRAADAANNVHTTTFAVTVTAPNISVISVSPASGDWWTMKNLQSSSGKAIVAWGNNTGNQTRVPSDLNGVAAIAAGGARTVALMENGTVASWGSSPGPPAGLSGVVAIAAGETHALALTSGGTVVGWGNNTSGQLNAPAGLGDVTAIAAGTRYSLALRGDGTVVAWGLSSDGRTSIPAGLDDVAAIAAGERHSLALRNDGSVVAWGYNGDGQTNVPAWLDGVVAVAAGYRHSLALKADGSVVSWGSPSAAWTIVPPAASSDVVAIAAGEQYSMALKGDGTVVTWGLINDGYSYVPAPALPWSMAGMRAIAAGKQHLVALGRERPVDLGTVKIGDQNMPGSSAWTLLISNEGTGPLSNLRMTLEGPSVAYFALEGTLPNSLAPGSTARINVQYTPKLGGKHCATVRIESNDPDENPYLVDLAGMAEQGATLASKTNAAPFTFGPRTLDPNTGLIVQKVSYHNSSGIDLPFGLSLELRNVPKGVVVLSSSAAATPGAMEVLYTNPIPAGETATFTLCYFDPQRRVAAKFQPQIWALPLEELVPPPDPLTGGLVPLLAVQNSAQGPVLQWNARVGATYVVEYSNDRRLTWYSAVHRLRASTARVIWIDRGQPETQFKPANKAARLYRVRKLP